MSIGRIAATALVVGAMAARPALAQFMPRVYCPPGQPSCFAAAFTYSNYVTGLPGHGFLDGTPLTVMSVYVQNLQGSYKWKNPQAFQLNTIGFFRQNGGYDNLSNSLFVNILPTSTNPPRSGGSYGPIRTGPNPFLSEYASADPITDLATSYSTDNSGGVMGCNLGRYASPWVGWGWQTCPKQGLKGWVKFDFALYWAEQVGVTPRFVTGNDFFLTMGGVNTSADYFCGFGRQIGIDPPVTACPDEIYDAAIVTPEPATVLLLATGILWLGGGSLVRRRQRRDVR